MLLKNNKILYILLFIVIALLIFPRVNKNNNKVETVFLESDTYKEEYIINLENEYLNSRNLNYFKDDIIAILPKIQDKYSSIIDNSWYSFDNTLSFKNNIDNFENKYIDLFNNSKLRFEAINIKYNGISINKIKVATKNINRYNNYEFERVNFE